MVKTIFEKIVFQKLHKDYSFFKIELYNSLSNIDFPFFYYSAY